MRVVHARLGYRLAAVGTFADKKEQFVESCFASWLQMVTFAFKRLNERNETKGEQTAYLRERALHVTVGPVVPGPDHHGVCPFHFRYDILVRMAAYLLYLGLFPAVSDHIRPPQRVPGPAVGL